MGKLIRNSVFETNSSSTHSITIGSYTDFDTIIPDYNGNITVPTMEFGWQIEDYNLPIERLSYLLIYVRDWTEQENKQIFKDMVYDLVLEHTGASDIIFPFGDDSEPDYSFNNGYIDHQSVEDKDLHYLFDNEDILKAFIFGRGGLIHTDNDNH